MAYKTKTAAPILAAGGIVLLALLVKYANGEASKQEVEKQVRATLKDPEQAEEYLELLEDEEILESLKQVA